MINATPPDLDPTTRVAVEGLYAALCSLITYVAWLLRRPSPLASRAERRQTSEAGRWRHE